MRYRTSGGRTFDKPRWVAARMRVRLDPDLTMRVVHEPTGEAYAAAPPPVERPEPHTPE